MMAETFLPLIAIYLKQKYPHIGVAINETKNIDIRNDLILNHLCIVTFRCKVKVHMRF